MNYIHSTILYSILTMTCIGALISCKQSPMVSLYKINGQTMGTTYHISYKGNCSYKKSIDSLLVVVNQQVSTYIDSSVISQFNRPVDRLDLSELLLQFPDTAQHFIQNYKISEAVNKMTSGYFDPTVMPLVNYWGFGYEKRKENLDTSMVDSILQLVGMALISTSNYTEFVKSKSGVQLDFSAVAKGYGVDEIANYLSLKGVKDFMVEIGGELRVSGTNSQEHKWVIGINQPKEKSTTNDLSLLIGITNCAVATSGNYRNYYMSKNQKFVHTINPSSGLMEQNNLLSATIVGSTCARVDAIATACMVMGVDDAKSLVLANEELEACFIYSLPTGLDSVWVTDGFKELIISN